MVHRSEVSRLVKFERRGMSFGRVVFGRWRIGKTKFCQGVGILFLRRFDRNAVLLVVCQNLHQLWREPWKTARWSSEIGKTLFFFCSFSGFASTRSLVLVRFRSSRRVLGLRKATRSSLVFLVAPDCDFPSSRSQSCRVFLTASRSSYRPSWERRFRP